MVITRKSKSALVAFGKTIINGFQKPYQRQKNILVRFEDGKGLNAKQMHLLLLKEKEDKNVNYEEML